MVHLELHTGDLPSASAYYARLCGWRPESIAACSKSYLALEWGGGLGGGIVECPTAPPLWLPYVEVAEVGAATERARDLGGLAQRGRRTRGWRACVLAAEALSSGTIRYAGTRGREHRPGLIPSGT